MNALSIYKDFDGLQRAALALFKSGYFTDAKSEAQAIVKVMAGSELGLPPFASMTGIHIIQGKPTLGSNVLATLVKNDPRYDYRIKQADDTACVLTWYEHGEKIGSAGFTIDEAAEAGLTGKDNWRKYTSDMLFARAISRGARRFAPGIFGGAPVYTPDEMGVDTNEQGFIDVKVVDVETEEIETKDVDIDPTPKAKTKKDIAKQKASGNPGLDAILDAVVAAGLSENYFSAKNALEKCRTGYATEDAAISWMRRYRSWRDVDKSTDDAAAKANAGEKNS